MTTLYSELEKLVRIYQLLGDEYRAMAYMKAIANPDYVGPRIKAKIKEFKETGKIQKISELMTEYPRLKYALAYDRILGFGIKLIDRVLDAGYNSPEELIAAINAGLIEIPEMARLGLKYRDDLARKIPRQTVNFVANRIKEFINADKIVIAGSYLRGNPYSGDIDLVIISNSSNSSNSINMDALKKSPEFIGTSVSGPSKITVLWKAAFVIAIDLNFVSEEDYIPALLHFTGSKRFNIYMREIARKLGMSLNQYGLFKRGKLIKVTSEKEIFDILKIPYVPPENRN